MTATDLPGAPADSRLIELLAHLIAMPTESRTPNQALIDWFASFASVYGGRVTIDDGPHGRANVLASFGPDVIGGLLLSGHSDVVAAGSGWASPAYELTSVADRWHGRGTADMKGFIACSMQLVESIDVPSLATPLHIALSFDEEVGCIGVRSLLQRLAPGGDLSTVQPDLVVIGEPTMMRPRHAHLGKLAAIVTVTASAGHSSLSPFQPSAIVAAARIIEAVQQVTDRHAHLASHDHTGEATVEVSANVGTIAGGAAVNVIAERCEFNFEIRHSTDFDADRLLVPVMESIDEQRRALAGVGGGVDFTELTRYPALRTDTNNAWVHLVERVADRGPCIPIGYGTEGGLIAGAIAAPVVICGPGDIGVAHKPDEYVATEQLHACQRFLAALTEAVCGASE